MYDGVDKWKIISLEIIVKSFNSMFLVFNNNNISVDLLF